MADASRDGNFVTTLIAASNVDGVTPVKVYADPVTHRLLISAAAGQTSSPWEQLTGTQSGNNVTLDLTGLSHTFVTILGVSMNGQILTPTSSWTRVGNTITVTNGGQGADANSDYLISYTY